jgi:hypothetical protein
MIPEATNSVEIVDLRTSDTLAGSDDPVEAEKALLTMIDDSPEEARFLCMIFFDRYGLAIGSRMAEEYVSF